MKKLKELKQADGQITKITPTTFEQIWGSDGTEKYGTHDEIEYAGKLDDMNKSDLYAEAVKRAILPNDNREQLKKKLMKAFIEHKNAYTFRPPPIKQTTKVTEEVRKILAEGR